MVITPSFTNLQFSFSWQSRLIDFGSRKSILNLMADLDFEIFSLNKKTALFVDSFFTHTGTNFIDFTGRSCGTTASVLNSAHQGTGTSYQDTVQYTCNTGYSHFSGDLVRTCTAAGLWSGSAPFCRSKPGTMLF